MSKKIKVAGASDWARYVAKDRGGMAYEYEHEPKRDYIYDKWAPVKGLSAPIKGLAIDGAWDKSLRGIEK